jgi:hypothetical protein
MFSSLIFPHVQHTIVFTRRKTLVDRTIDGALATCSLASSLAVASIQMTFSRRNVQLVRGYPNKVSTFAMNDTKFLVRIVRGVGRDILHRITYALFYETTSELLYMYFLAAVTMVRLVCAATRLFASWPAVLRRALSHSHLICAGWY